MTRLVDPMTDKRIAYLRAYAASAGPHGTVLRECLDEIEMLRKEAAGTADELLGAGALAPVYANIVRGDRDGYKARSVRLQDECDRLRSLLVDVRCSVEASTDADMHLTAATIDAGLAL